MKAAVYDQCGPPNVLRHEDIIAAKAEQLGAGHEIAQLGLAAVEVDPHAQSATRAAVVASATMRLWAEWARVVVGQSTRELPLKDPRFSDPAWRDHPLYRRLGQGYLAFCDAVDALAGESKDWRTRERAKFLTGILTSSLAPGNTLLGNPAALKRAFETGCGSLLAGLKNMAGDLVDTLHIVNDGHLFLMTGSRAVAPLIRNFLLAPKGGVAE